MTARTIRSAVAAGCAALAAGAGVSAQQPPTVVMPVPQILQNYNPVTPDRLLIPEDSDVLMVRRTYDGWGYSPLKQVDTSNVSRLQPVWSFATGAVSGHEAVSYTHLTLPTSDL